MGVESSISSKVLLRHVVGILTIISLEAWVPSLSLPYGNREHGKCKVIIGSLFDNYTERCSSDKPLLELQPFGEYLVDNESQSFASISELERRGDACFCPPPDTDVSTIKFFSFLKSRERPSFLAFLRDCTSFPIVGDDLPPDFTCPSNGTNHSYVALMGRHEDRHLNKSACKSPVIVPVELARDDRENKDECDENIEKLKQGFRLKWDLTSWESRVKCKISGGKCRGSEKRFLCRGNTFRLIPCCGFGALASIFLCSCLYMIRQKQQHCFLIFHSRHASSDSSTKADLEVGDVCFGVPIFPNAELEEATNHFDTARELGDGGFGIVYYGKLRDGREVAVKRLFEHNYQRMKQFITEVEILTRLRHKNLVSLYGCTSRHSRELLLVYEYIPNGTVADHLQGERAKQDPLPWRTRISIAIETATALAYLHASDIIHRDVKTNNILLDNNFCVKVADFGLSRLFPNNVSHVSTAPQGTPGYVDPEYHQYYQLTEKSDVYSFGVVLVELISSMPAVDISRDRHEINLANLATSKIRNHEFRQLIDPNLGFESDPEINRMITAVAELAFRCLQQEKDMRPSMETVLEELKAISSGKHEPDKSKDVSYDNSASQSENPPPSPECDNMGLLKITKAPTSPVSVTQKWEAAVVPLHIVVNL
ncbi:hypothetical protein ACJRO7_028324 [Eucalyptus globulus]|uniref:Protein kinase domain-containing protein n=1 Tax=Eucalyptus globulus TaxID=34317 RepID=A0ABD3JXW2_EUCGL